MMAKVIDLDAVCGEGTEDAKPELVELLRNAHPTEPRIGAERIQPRTRKGNGPYWVREQWRQCDCPDCDKVAHWMMVAGGPNRADVERA